MVEKLKKELINQKKSKYKGNIYYVSQINFAYNSNKIEGSFLTEDQTEAIFITSTYIYKTNDLIKFDKITETKNHFKLFDYILENYNKTLTKDMILEMHKILKKSTSDEKNSTYNIGSFKTIPNVIGTVNTVSTSNPKSVEKDLDKLLNEYLEKNNIKLEDIIDFHIKFERIHPFTDGNGRIGRIIMFKECLKNNIMPFIILDKNKEFYMRGLKEYYNDKKY